MATGQLWLFPPPKPLVDRLGEQFFQQLPERPGVYLMCAGEAGVLYVGRAKNLRRRLSSYRVANSERLSRRMVRLMYRVTRIEFDECATESQAREREEMLICVLAPQFNRAGKVWPTRYFFSKNFPVARRRRTFHLGRMSEIIYPRSPRETMDGWHYLPRYVDKIRLHLAGKLHADYQENLGKGFDVMWLKNAGVTHDEFVQVVKESVTDGEVCDWVRQNVKKTDAEKAAHWQDVLSRPLAGDAQAMARLKMRKEQAGIGHRDEIKCFVDMIDADEKRI